MSNFKDDLSSFKAQLEVIELEMNNKITSLNDDEQQHMLKEASLLKRLPLLPKTMKLNIGGTKFSALIKNIMNHKNTLFNFILEDENCDLTKEIYFERSPKFFDEILNFLKHKKFDFSRYDRNELKEITEEAAYFELNEMLAFLNNDCLFEPIIVSFSSNGPYITGETIVGDTDIFAIMTDDPFTGLTSGYPGQFEFVLEKPSEISSISFMGYYGNTNYFASTNGSASNIEASLDGKVFNHVGNFPTFNSDQKVQKFTVPTFKAKYIRIKSDTSYIGFSYIKFEK